jgi:two-component system chemotaxis response regulator CheY
LKILIVDDSLIDRKLLASTLEKGGVQNEIVQVEDGESALELLEKEHDSVCLMFIDWQLPKMDGLEVLKRVARNPKTESLPIIMLTSSISPETEEIAHLLNPNLKDFVMKPLDPAKIIRIALPHIK